jgi:uncharacterized membrane protein YedE/YeeE
VVQPRMKRLTYSDTLLASAYGVCQAEPAMQNFTPATALLGGALIGFAASALVVFTGHIAGISGIVGGVFRRERGEWEWRTAFIAGLLVGGSILVAFFPNHLGTPVRSFGMLAASGLLVGFGSRLGGGCTSGHGVCGLSRLSRRSLVATVTFIATGIGATTAIRLWGELRP